MHCASILQRTAPRQRLQAGDDLESMQSGTGTATQQAWQGRRVEWEAAASCSLLCAEGDLLWPRSTSCIASPEMIRFKLDQDAPAPDLECHDCWSLGCILVWLITGRLPFGVATRRDTTLRDKLEGVHAQHEAWVSS